VTVARGQFIVLEGTDGSGTTTQCRFLSEAIERRGIRCLVTCEPSKGPVGQLLRAALEKRLQRNGQAGSFDWATLALLFAADRADHVMFEIEPALAAGAWVISDRYTLSSLIYQSITAPRPEDARSWVTELNRHARAADLVIVLDVMSDVAEARRAARGGEEELFDRRELQTQLASAYCEANQYSGATLEHIDGNAPTERVAATIWETVQKHFPDLCSVGA